MWPEITKLDDIKMVIYRKDYEVMTEEEKIGLISNKNVWIRYVVMGEELARPISFYIGKYDKEFYEKYKLLFR